MMRLCSCSLVALLLGSLVLGSAGCGGDSAPAAAGSRGSENRRGPGLASVSQPAIAAVPVQVAPVQRQAIAEQLEANGVLSAEHEVDLVARVAGPVVELLAEEGMRVDKGQLLAVIDDRELLNQVAVAQVNRDVARRDLDRAQASWDSGLISREAYDAALSALETATTQLESARINLGYTRITAPFAGVIAVRSVRRAEHVQVGATLLRISDFIPLLCTIQVPERHLRSIAVGQTARLGVEAFPEREFLARVLRIRPTIDAATGTITVTLDVDGQGLLRPGMFASVALEVASHDNALVIPRQALVLDSIGDAIFVVQDGVAVRREVKLGFRTADRQEVLDGVQEHERVIVLGQEGLSDGTPVVELAGDTDARSAAAPVDRRSPAAQPTPTAAAAAPPLGPPDQPPAAADGPPQGQAPAIGFTRPGPAGSGPTGNGGGPPPQLLERLRDASPEQLERFKERMRQRGLSDEQIEQLVQRARSGQGK